MENNIKLNTTDEKETEKLSDKEIWEDPEVRLLSADKTEFLAPDVIDGGGPYS